MPEHLPRDIQEHLPQAPACPDCGGAWQRLGEDISEVLEYRSEEHTSELQSLMRISYAVFCLKKKKIAARCHRKVKRTPRSKCRELCQRFYRYRDTKIKKTTIT